MKKIQTLFSILTGISLAVVFVVTFGQVVQRYVFQISMPWATDIIRIFFIYSVFFGMGVGVFKKSHLNIDVLIHAFPSWTKTWFELLSNLVVGVFLSVVFYYSISFTMANTDQVTNYLLIPMSYVYMVVPITVGFMVLFLALDTLRIFGSLVGRSGKSSPTGR